MRVRSEFVGPAGLPMSRSECCAQRRIAWPVQPNFSASETIAAHFDPCSRSCSKTIRTTRYRPSGEYL